MKSMDVLQRHCRDSDAQISTRINELISIAVNPNANESDKIDAKFEASELVKMLNMRKSGVSH